jgi:hypothetical protein
MTIPRFDIFRGRYPETDVEWVECVQGFEAAFWRMKTIAAKEPGPYFVFDTRSHEVLASIDTTPKAKASDVA